MSVPTTDKMANVKDVLLYLKGTSAYGLRLGGLSCVFHGFCDANFAGCKITRRSTTRFVVKSSVGSVSWKPSGNQGSVPRARCRHSTRIKSTDLC
jgi:hypothetical protein